MEGQEENNNKNNDQLIYVRGMNECTGTPLHVAWYPSRAAVSSSQILAFWHESADFCCCFLPLLITNKLSMYHCLFACSEGLNEARKTGFEKFYISYIQAWEKEITSRYRYNHWSLLLHFKGYILCIYQMTLPNCAQKVTEHFCKSFSKNIQWLNPNWAQKSKKTLKSILPLPFFATLTDWYQKWVSEVQLLDRLIKIQFITIFSLFYALCIKKDSNSNISWLFWFFIWKMGTILIFHA